MENGFASYVLQPQVEPDGRVHVLTHQTSPHFITDSLGRARYPLHRFGFSYGICRHLAVALLDIAIHDVGPDQGLDKPADLASTHDLVEPGVDIFVYSDCQLLLHTRPIHLYCTYNVTLIGTDTTGVMKRRLSRCKRNRFCQPQA